MLHTAQLDNESGSHTISGKLHHLSFIAKYILIFLIITAIQVGLLVLSACIPGRFIRTNMMQSADYLTEQAVFFNIDESDSASRIDRYADSILLGIAYGYDENKPLSSVMRASYYHTNTQNENDNLKDAVYNNLTPNYDYVRYWHGSNAVVRPLLVFFNIKQIYIINAVILSILFVLMLVMLKKTFGTGIAVSFSISAVMMSIWYVPFSLEYTWTFFIMFISALLIMLNYKKNHSVTKLLPIFFITGSMTAYFDFLTTETLTLLIPLILLLIMEYDAETLSSFKSGIKTSLHSGVLWGLGYISSWLAKWTLASVILGENAFSSALTNAANRINGEAYEATGFSLRLGAVISNISCIFPFSHIQKYAFILCIFCFIFACFIYYLIRKNKNTCPLPGLFAVLAFMPYIRFLVLANHSYQHYFFTFRAQMTTMLCIALIFYYGTDRSLLKKEWRKIWKKMRKKK